MSLSVYYLFIHSEIGQNGGLPFFVVCAGTMQFPAQGGKLFFRNTENGYRRMVESANIDLVFRFQSVENLVGFSFSFIRLLFHHSIGQINSAFVFVTLPQNSPLR